MHCFQDSFVQFKHYLTLLFLLDFILISYSNLKISNYPYLFFIQILSSIIHLTGFVYDIGESRDFDFKSLLDLVQNFYVFGLIRVDKSDDEPFGSEAAGAADPVQLLVTLLGDVVIDHHVDFADVHTSRENVSGDQNGARVFLERGVAFQSLLLVQTPVQTDALNAVTLQDTLEFHCAVDALHENDQLVEREVFDDGVDLAVLLGFLELHCVLLQAVQGEITIIVDYALYFVAHELACGVLDCVAHGGRKHHGLFVLGGADENVLHVGAHDGLGNQPVALVQHEELHILQRHFLLFHQFEQPAGRGDKDVRVGFDALFGLAHGHAALDAL